MRHTLGSKYSMLLLNQEISQIYKRPRLQISRIGLVLFALLAAVGIMATIDYCVPRPATAKQDVVCFMCHHPKPIAKTKNYRQYRAKVQKNYDQALLAELVRP